MRVQLFNDLESGAYGSKLLQIGEGRLETNVDGKIEFTNDFCHPLTTEDELISHVYPNLENNIKTMSGYVRGQCYCRKMSPSIKLTIIYWKRQSVNQKFTHE